MEPVGRVTCNASGASTTTVGILVGNAAARLDPARMTPLTIEVQQDGVPGIHAWAGIYIRHPKSIIEVIREAMDSVCGWACPTRDGTRLRLGRMLSPTNRAGLLTISPDNVVGAIIVEADKAKGLTTTLAGRRNWSPMSHSEIAAAITHPSGPWYDPNLAEFLQAEYGEIRQGVAAGVGSMPLSDAYAQARFSRARGTLLQSAEHIQAEANRVCGLWYPPRHFLRCAALLDAVQADGLEPGDFLLVRWPRFGLETARAFQVVAVRSSFWSRLVDLTLWGSLPVTYGGDK